MNMGIETTTTTAIAGWTHERGSCVRHANYQHMQGIVIERSRTAAGRELYALWNIYDDDGRIKHLLGDTLVTTELGGATCQGCPYWHGGECCA